MNEKKRIVILTSDVETAPFVVHTLEAHFDVVKVIIEEPVSRLLFLQRRIKKCGVVSVVGQVLFSVFVVPLLKWEAKERLEEIKKESGFLDGSIDERKVVRVQSVNDAATALAVAASAPQYCIVWGTRILSKALIEKISVPIINIHVGITPQYRGSHGGYWALYNNDAAHMGVTVHLIDEGIDTGGVLEQGVIVPSKADNFVTYPLLQLAKGLLLLISILQIGTIAPSTVTGASGVWYHPTIGQYIFKRITGGVT